MLPEAALAGPVDPESLSCPASRSVLVSGSLRGFRVSFRGPARSDLGASKTFENACERWGEPRLSDSKGPTAKLPVFARKD